MLMHNFIVSQWYKKTGAIPVSGMTPVVRWGNKHMLRRLVCYRGYSGFFQHFVAEDHEYEQEKSEDHHTD